MPRTKKGLIQKQEKLRAEEKRLLAEKRRLQEKRVCLQKEKERKIRLWDAQYRPKMGTSVLYVEEVNGKRHYSWGPVIKSKRYTNGTFDFEVDMRACGSAHPKRHTLIFEDSHLDPVRGISSCFTDAYVKHLKDDNDYVNLMMHTYQMGRKKNIFYSKTCKYGDHCINKKVGHLLNFRH